MFTHEHRHKTAGSVTHSMGNLVELVHNRSDYELQLLKAEVKRFRRELFWPGIAFALGILFVASCVPLVVIGAAFTVTQLTAMPFSVSLLLLAGIVMGIGLILCLRSWRQIKTIQSPFHRVYQDISDDVRWFKSQFR